MNGLVACGPTFLTGVGNRGRGRPRHTSPHAFVHGLIGQAVGFGVVFAKGVADGEPFELGD